MSNPMTGEHTDSVQIPYAPDLYRFDTAAKGIAGGFPAVSEADIEYFHQHGYLVINDAFSPTEVEAALAGMTHLMDGKCPDFRAIQFEPKLVKQKNALEGQERRNAIRKIFNFVDHEPRLNAMATHSGLLGVLEQIVDDTPEIVPRYGTPQTPALWIRKKPWHQDCAYFNLPEGTTVVGVWVALDEATPENGCLHVIPGSHIEGPMIHFKRRDWQICDTDCASSTRYDGPALSREVVFSGTD